jgi:hypothetical protein
MRAAFTVGERPRDDILAQKIGANMAILKKYYDS